MYRWLDRAILVIVIALFVVVGLVERAYSLLQEENRQAWRGHGLDCAQTILFDSQDYLWEVSQDGQLYVLELSFGEFSEGSSAIASDVSSDIQNLAIDGNGQVWGSRGNEIGRLAPDGTWVEFVDQTPQDIHALAIDSKERVWAATDEGLGVRDKDGRWETYFPTQYGLPSDPVLAIALGEQEDVWIGTAEAVAVRHGNGHWDTYLTDDPVHALVVDKQGRLWFGSATAESGLRILEPEGSQYIYTTTNSGLPGDSICAFILNSQGHVWMSTSRGMRFVDTSQGLPATIPSSFLTMRNTLFALLGVGIIIGLSRVTLHMGFELGWWGQRKWEELRAQWSLILYSASIGFLHGILAVLALTSYHAGLSPYTLLLYGLNINNHKEAIVLFVILGILIGCGIGVWQERKYSGNYLITRITISTLLVLLAALIGAAILIPFNIFAS